MEKHYTEIFLKKIITIQIIIILGNQTNNDEQKLLIIKENLTCFMLKLNYIDEPEILLGYR